MEVYVLGVAQHPAAERVADKRLEEMVFDTTRAALDDAGIERRQIDHVTIAACDELDGRSISSMLLAAPAGAYLKDENKCTDSGLIGLCLGAMRIAAGDLRLGLVVSWNKSSIAPFEDVMRMRAEPFFTRPVGLNRTIADGLFAQAVGRTLGIDGAAADRAVADAYGRAATNPRGLGRPVPGTAAIAASAMVATPLRAGHQAPVTDGAVAMVLAAPEWLKENPDASPIARLCGLGWATDSYQLGAERLGALASYRKAVGQAVAMAGLAGPNALDLIEIDGQTGFHQAAFARAFEPALAGAPDRAAATRISPSGGAFAQNPYFCAGLSNAAEAVLQVAGRAGPVQVPGARLAAGHGCHGFAQQGNAVAIFAGIEG